MSNLVSRKLEQEYLNKRFADWLAWDSKKIKTFIISFTLYTYKRSMGIVALEIRRMVGFAQPLSSSGMHIMECRKPYKHSMSYKLVRI
jgi:hypothetical protein